MIPDPGDLSTFAPSASPTAGGPVDPAAVLEAPGPVRAAGAFLLVLLLGAVVLSLFEAGVDRSIDASLDRPVLSTVYGLVAQAAAGAAAAYVYSLIAGAGPVVVGGGLTIVALAWLAVAVVGFLVAGGVLTVIVGTRQPWTGLVVGAGIAAVPWLLPSVTAGVTVWLVVVSLGIGGRTREWVHASPPVAPDTDDLS